MPRAKKRDLGGGKMEKVLLVVCKGCQRVRRYGSWFFMTQEQRTLLFLNYRVEKVRCICPVCWEKIQPKNGVMTPKWAIK